MENGIIRKIITEDGEVYTGRAFGAVEDRVLEIVFNTSMAGYQEILSDPSYTDQAVVMTYPLIGNYGIAEEDFETRHPSIGAMLIRSYNDKPSNFRCIKTLSEILEDYNIPGVEQLDTRKLTRSIRDGGSRRILITSPETDVEAGIAIIKSTPVPNDAVRRVSCRKKWVSRTQNHQFHVVAVDCGIKLNIVRSLNRRGCNVTVVPYATSAEEILSLMPDGLLLSNGPGNPEDCVETIETVRALMGKLPILGICLGHQITALACGASTYKLKFGHRGGNHPVKNLLTGRVEMTAQNHSFAVDEATLPGTGLVVTHRNLLDGTVEGMSCPEKGLESVQYHPESAPGPEDSGYLFDRFIARMEEKSNAETH